MGCAAGRTELIVGEGAPREERLCVRPGTVVSLVLLARAGERWTAVASSAPALALPFGWRVAADGTAHTAVRCAVVRAGRADITVTARAPDLAGPAPVGFTLRLSVLPRPKEC